jgi:hypothetical protein
VPLLANLVGVLDTQSDNAEKHSRLTA